jgi:ATP-dependent RNA helicase RhlE
MTDIETTSGFAAAGLHPALVQLLADGGITNPTPIQAAAIPAGLEGKDIIGIAQTGTGKTLAYALPLITKLRNNGGKAIILAPTRELALQIEEAIRTVTERMRPPMPTAVLIGGMAMYAQVRSMSRRPRIVIATPGRLEDHIKQRTIKLDDVNSLVLDEADRMLDMGFIPAIKRIASLMPTKRQTMLFSATMDKEVTALAQEYMSDPQWIEVASQGTPAEQIEQQICFVSPERKPDVLEMLLSSHDGPTLVFSRTKHGASKLSEKLSRAGHNATEIHSNRSLSQRRHSLDGFKSGRYRVLVATDVASRGIDVKDIALVVNYDLPDVTADYVS